MARVIELDSWGEDLPDVLTRTGGGGFLSTGYLADRPAIALVEHDETVRYVLTNRKRGVRVESGDSTHHVKPDGGHRTVVVVTDRRLLVLVGRTEGDEETAIELGAITAVEAATGRRTGELTLERADGTRWQIPTDREGLDGVAGYLREAADAWRAVEESLEGVESALSAARGHLDAGDFDRALSTAQGTQSGLERAGSRASTFASDRPGEAIQRRVDTVAQRREATVHLTRAREATATGNRQFRTGDYEAALAAFEQAHEAYDSALSVGTLDDPETVLAKRERLQRRITAIDDSPLMTAITADKRAVAADDPGEAATHWERALSAYREAVDDGDGLFRGDPDRLRDRLETVAESLTAARRSVAADARRTGDWYADTEQHDAALEAFESASEALDVALETATENYPEAVPHLIADADAIQRRIDRTRAARDGEERPPDRIDTDDDPTYDVSAVLGEVDEPSEIADAIEPPSADGSSDSTVELLGNLDAAGVKRVVGEALDATRWDTDTASPRSPFDLLATQGELRVGVVVSEGPVTAELVTECAEVTGAAGTDAVLLATTATLPEAIVQQAKELGVQTLDRASLAAIVDAEQLTLPRPVGDSR